MKLANLMAISMFIRHLQQRMLSGWKLKVPMLWVSIRESSRMTSGVGTVGQWDTGSSRSLAESTWGVGQCVFFKAVALFL